MPIPSRKWMWVTLLLTLLLGMSVGVLLDRVALTQGARDSERAHDYAGRSERFLAHLDRELNLSAEQKEELKQVLAANREKAEAFWVSTRSSYADLRKEFRRQIRDLLTPEQQTRYDEMLAAEDAKREQRRQER